MDDVIRVEGLGKRFLLSRQRGYALNLRGMLEGVVRAPWRRSGQIEAAHDSRYVWALQEVSFSLKPGEVLGLIGSNGAGKSVLLKILARITKPTAGYARVRGR